MSFKMLLIGSQLAHLYDSIHQSWPQIHIDLAPSATAINAQSLQAEALIASPLDAQQLVPQMPHLSWVQSIYAGVDPLLQNELPKDYCLTNIKGVFGPLMAEYVFGYLLSLQRQHQGYAEQQQHQQWQALPYQPLRHSSLLCLGAGSTAEGIAQMAQQFKMPTAAITRSGKAGKAFDEVSNWEHAAPLLQQADIIVNTLPATAATYHCINAELLSLFPREGLFINVGRGATVDESALLEFLAKTPQMHAILDVFEQEPLPASHPFWEHPQVTVTPHVAAPSLMEDIEAQILANISRYVNQQPLSNVIDFSLGY